jgi:type VI secretion system ImpC/EvpB family protein
MSSTFAQPEPGSPAWAQSHAAVPAVAAPFFRGLLGDVLEATSAAGSAAEKLDTFLREPSLKKALADWLLWTLPPGASIDTHAIPGLLARDIAGLDAAISAQLNSILHHPRFQKLESSWRGLRYLADRIDEDANVRVQVLHLPWKELVRDMERAVEFDQSQLFRKVYSEEFDMPGGQPFGLLLGDYEIHHRPTAEHPFDDVGVLGSVSHLAAASFTPFVAGVHPSMFGVDRFTGLEMPLNLSGTFEQLEYLKWKAFRDSEDSRFVGLSMPRVLMRLPYEDEGDRVDGFRFREDVSRPDQSQYLWGNAAYAFGAVVIRAFSESGWLARIRGVRRGEESGGLAPDLPVHCFSTDRRGIAPKCSTDSVVTDYQEQELGELGFIPLCHCPDTEFSAFYGNQSTQNPKKYDEQAATTNARLSSMLQYMLCVSRFAHYIKVIARDKIGSFAEAEECERFLHDWLQNYVISDSDASPDRKARYPLREATVRVRENPEKPGAYLCVAHLWPHYELDELSNTMRIATELTHGSTP